MFDCFRWCVSAVCLVCVCEYIDVVIVFSLVWFAFRVWVFVVCCGFSAVLEPHFVVWWNFFSDLVILLCGVAGRGLLVFVAMITHVCGFS